MTIFWCIIKNYKCGVMKMAGFRNSDVVEENGGRMITIAVLDDEHKWIDEIRRIIERYFIGRKLKWRFLEYSSQERMLLDMDEGTEIDLFLLDVELKCGSGLNVAVKIRDRDAFSAIIYVTNYPEYAPAAFEVNAFRYILKRELAEKLPLALDKICPQLMNKDERCYIVKDASGIKKIYYRDILYVKKDGKYIRIFQKDGTYSMQRKTMDEIEKILGADYIRIDKGCLVNILHVMCINNRQCQMRDDAMLPISQRKYTEVKKRVWEYWERADIPAGRY